MFGNFYYFPEKNKVKAKCWCFTFIFAKYNCNYTNKLRPRNENPRIPRACENNSCLRTSL